MATPYHGIVTLPSMTRKRKVLTIFEVVLAKWTWIPAYYCGNDRIGFIYYYKTAALRESKLDSR